MLISQTQLRIIRYIVALAILGTLVFIVDYRSLIDVFQDLTFPVIVYLILISLLLVYISAIKWQYFLEAFGEKVSALRLTKLYFIGYFVNTFVPSYVGGDVVRSWLAGKKGDKHAALSATLLERYTGLLAMLILALIFMWHIQAATLWLQLTIIGLSGGLIALTVIALSDQATKITSYLPKGEKLLPHIQKMQYCLQLAKKDTSLLIKSLALSFLFHSVTVLNTYAAAGAAVGWQAPPVYDLFVVLPLILLLGALPFTPSGLGIQEGAFLYFLTAVGATPAQALGVGVILRAKSYLLGVFGGLLWLTEQPHSKPRGSTEEKNEFEPNH